MTYPVKILGIEKLSDNIIRIQTEKPKDYNFIPGQHATITIDDAKLKFKTKPFSFSSSNKENFLEFIIKIYPEREGFTKKVSELSPGDILSIGEPRGKIYYKGRGIFIAAGTGINPFISILKSLNKKEKRENLLFYMNKTEKEIVLKEWLKKILGKKAVFTLTRENKKFLLIEKINKEFLKKQIKNFNQRFYLCGPFEWVKQIKNDLIELGTDKQEIISEV